MNEETALTIVEDTPTEVAPIDLLGSSPVARLEEARRVSDLLAPIIRERRLYVLIHGKEYVLFEGWTLLGSLLGVFPSTESCCELKCDDGAHLGFEARVVAKTLTGQIVGTAIARCTRDEPSWSNRPDYAVQSMAQTRAGAKALRMPLGFVMQLAGYSATPADEIPDEEPRQEEPAAPTTITPAQRKRLFAKAAGASDRIGVPVEDVRKWMRWKLEFAMGVEGASTNNLTPEQYGVLCEAIEKLTLSDMERSVE